MKTKLVLLALVVIGAVAITAGILMSNGNAKGETQPAGPIMYMSPRASMPMARENMA